MGRAYTRDELIVEVAAASGNLREVSSNGAPTECEHDLNVADSLTGVGVAATTKRTHPG